MSLAVQPILSRLDSRMKRHEQVEFLLCEAALQGEIISPSRAKKILSAHHKAQLNQQVITYADPTGERATSNVLAQKRTHAQPASNRMSSSKNHYSTSYQGANQYV